MTSRPSRAWAVMLALGFCVTVLVSVVRSDDAADEWKAPPRAAARKNPIPADDASIAAGKAAYAANCLACHGAKGKGDGPAAPSLKRPVGDLSSQKAQEQTDGALFWKITEGRPPMPAFEKLLAEDQRWHVVNYIRTLASSPTTPKSTLP